MASLEKVREGMKVLDADGNEVGTVAEVKMGDPEAITAEGQALGGGNAVTDSLVETFSQDLTGEQADDERLLRLGYVKVDPKGVLKKDRYIASDEIERVEAEAVHLAGNRPTRREDRET